MPDRPLFGAIAELEKQLSIRRHQNLGDGFAKSVLVKGCQSQDFTALNDQNVLRDPFGVAKLLATVDVRRTSPRLSGVF